MALRPQIPSNAERAISLAMTSQKMLSPRDPFLRSNLNVFDGNLLIITLFSEKDERHVDCHVFIDSTGDHFFYNQAELARFFDSKRNHPPSIITQFSKEIFSPGGAPAVIAVIITFTICYLAILRLDVPPILANALATILGFYFGIKADRTKPPRNG